MSDAIPYKQIIDRVKSDIDWIAEQAHAKGYNEAKLIYQNPNAESDYQRGLDDGKARNEDGCIGCMYEDVTAEHAPCKYCCNAYSNKWEAKPKSNDFKIGEEVITSNKKRAIVIDVDVIEETNATIVKVLKGAYTWWYKISELTKTGRYFPQIEELFKAMKEGVE